jgi:hypothetical protein
LVLENFLKVHKKSSRTACPLGGEGKHCRQEILLVKTVGGIDTVESEGNTEKFMVSTITGSLEHQIVDL